MPKNCGECVFLNTESNFCFLFSYGCVDRYSIDPDIRQEWCGLEELPPHGRLIDADAFAMGVINSFMDCADLFDDANSLAKAAEITDAFVRDINEAPTIIPADKGGEG